jgi:bifunctional UDP-N-acetylglucosamine pyrophosphorylase/glucosamine-1-phosphate N-acetyltransferase
VVLDDHREMIGINTRCDLAHAAKILNERALAALMNEGVTVIDPATTWVEPGCRIGRDVILEPGVVVRRGTVIGEDARIGAHSVLDGAVVAPGEAVPPLSHKAKAPDS